MKKLLLPLLLSSVVEAEQYSFVDFKVGTFADPCLRDCTYNDGRLPAYLSIGHHWDLMHGVDLEVEFQHRSNFDQGWPFGSNGSAHEYERNGVFVKMRYRFNRSEF